VSLVGWTVRDVAGMTWTLDSLGFLNGGQEKTIKRIGQPMSLNNDGDTIELVNHLGRTVQTVTYDPVGEGDVVTPWQSLSYGASRAGPPARGHPGSTACLERAGLAPLCRLWPPPWRLTPA
jgi:hypothetical protein